MRNAKNTCDLLLKKRNLRKIIENIAHIGEAGARLKPYFITVSTISSTQTYASEKCVNQKIATL